MHPAYSVIIFTTSSGAGYGLLFWLSLAHAMGSVESGSWGFFVTLCLALVLITIGLLSSTLHLGHPERAWRALSQWRSSWLSREGVIAIATFVPAGLLALISLSGIQTGWSGSLAVLSAIGAGLTVYCTGMIYASLRTIRQWHLGLVPAIYLALAGASGALLFLAALAVQGKVPFWALALALVTTLAALGLKLAYYRRIDNDPGLYTDKMALGLGAEVVRQLDPPHTMANFVMREMGYEIARRHADRLRRLVFIALFAIPLLLIAVMFALDALRPALGVIAVLSAAIGLFVERWLFFAEATHVSMLFYGKARA